MPIRPLRDPRHFFSTGPGQALTAHADAVAHRLALAEHQIEICVRRIDNDRAARFLAPIVDDRPAELRRHRFDRAGLGLVLGRQRESPPAAAPAPSALAEQSHCLDPHWLGPDKERPERERRMQAQIPVGLGNPDKVGLAGNGCGNAAAGDPGGCPNPAFIALQSATSCGLTFGNDRGQRLSTRLHDRHDAVDLQPDAFPAGAVYKTRTLTGQP